MLYSLLMLTDCVGLRLPDVIMSDYCSVALFIHYILMQRDGCCYVRFLDYIAQIMGYDAAINPNPGLMG